MSSKDLLCQFCNKTISTKSNLLIHQKTAKSCLKIQQKDLDDDFKCTGCQKKFTQKCGYDKHARICSSLKLLSQMDQSQRSIEIKYEAKLEEQQTKYEVKLRDQQRKYENQLKDQKQEYKTEIDKLINRLERLADNNLGADLYGYYEETEEEKEVKTSEPVLENKRKLVLNEIVITSRKEDNYINATQLCKAGGKKFNVWYRSESTQALIKELEEDMKKSVARNVATEINGGNTIQKGSAGIPADPLVDIKQGGTQQGSWIHPDLGIQLAQWISPKIAIQVSRWVRQLCSVGKVEIDLKALKENYKRIKQLEDKCIERQRRVEYKENNVIYILTTENNKKERIYTFGKAKSLTERLSSYNKSEEHDVIYYKECQNEKHMNLMEQLIFYKLDEYREKANRERFILPDDKDIQFFIDVVDKTINT